MTPNVKSMKELKEWLTKEFPQFGWRDNYESDGLMATNKDDIHIDVVPEAFRVFKVVVVIQANIPFTIIKRGEDLKEVVAQVCTRIQQEVNLLVGAIKDLGG